VSSALDGLRVLDLTRLLPGPFCTMLLGDLGADVIKIEEPGGGDPARSSPLFLQVNRNKRSLTLDLKATEGYALFLRLLDSADILVEGFRPGVMDRLGLGYPALAERNPRLIYASLSGFGQSGPYRDRPGHDLNYLALAGAVGYNVGRDGHPVPMALQVADLGAGSFAAVVSLFASAISWLPTLIAPLFASGHALAPGEPVLAGGLPQYDVYRTADDRFVTLGALEPKFFSNFLEQVGRTDLDLIRDRAELRSELARIFASRTLREWVTCLDGVDTCFAPVNTLEEALSDPQAEALGLFAAGQLAPPFAFSATPAAIRRAPPRLGEHTQEVLKEVGLDETTIEDLAKRRVV
jgi:crotonobetainyl-CoA:carnitine CoA-transferase CaiB-like acyl-CoA transferase